MRTDYVSTDVRREQPRTEGRAGYTPMELAGMLGVPSSTVYTNIRRGKIPSNRIGRRIVVPADWLERFLEGKEEGEG